MSVRSHHPQFFGPEHHMAVPPVEEGNAGAVLVDFNVAPLGAEQIPQLLRAQIFRLQERSRAEQRRGMGRFVAC